MPVIAIRRWPPVSCARRLKNRTELAECVTAADRGPLSAEELAAVHKLRVPD